MWIRRRHRLVLPGKIVQDGCNYDDQAMLTIDMSHGDGNGEMATICSKNHVQGVGNDGHQHDVGL